MPSGLFYTVVNIGLKYLAISVILFQKSALVVEPYFVYPESGFNKWL